MRGTLKKGRGLTLHRQTSPALHARVGALAALVAIGACAVGAGDPTVVGPASPEESTIMAAPDEVKADGVSASTITVQLKDLARANLPQGGDLVELVTTLGTLSPVTDHNNGTYSATLRSTTTGAATIRGSVNGGAISTGNPTVRFVP